MGQALLGIGMPHLAPEYDTKSLSEVWKDSIYNLRAPNRTEVVKPLSLLWRMLWRIDSL